MTAYEIVERKLRDGMVEGEMHVCLRDIGRLAGGYKAAGILTAGDMAALQRLAVGLSKTKGVGERTWAEAVEFGRRQPVEFDDLQDQAFDWGDRVAIGARRKIDPEPEERAIVDAQWVEPDEIPQPAADWATGDMIRYLEAMFEPDEHVGIVATAWHQEDSGRWLPQKGVCDRTRAELCDLLRAGDQVEAIGDVHPAAGAWVRINPLDGAGVKDANVTAFRHTLIEADDQDLGKQLALIRQMRLPCSAIVHSGGKSIHALVRVDAANADEYRARVDRLYAVCKASGLKADGACRNPSRLSRLPGVLRGQMPQYLIDVCAGCESWTEWEAYIDEVQDDLPDPEPLAAVFDNLPPLRPALIEGILRDGHKMRLTGPSKAGKSFGLIELCCAIAEGREWMGYQCRQGAVLYVNLELDPASCLWRFRNVYEALGWPTETVSAIDIWNLRGHAVPLDRLAPKLIRRAAGKRYAAVVIDPIYKLSWGDENDAGDVARFCNNLDRICNELGAAVIDAHHHSKGTQGQKRSIDRGSGSGVFGRDPDAILDMIELDLSAKRRDQVAGRIADEAVEAACARLGIDFDAIPADARGQADALVLAGHAAYPRHGGEIADAVAEARETAARMSGWRIEATLREFAAPDPRRVWFRHPVHTADVWDLLTDAKAAGEAPPWEAEREAKQERRQQEADRKTEALEKAIEADGGPGRATIRGVASSLGWSEDTVRRQIAKSDEYRNHRGVILESENAE